MGIFEVKDQLPECDWCERTDSIRVIGNSKACPDHFKDAEASTKPAESKPVDTSPIAMNEVLKASRQADAQIQVRTDIHNAETLAIAKLYEAIDHDAAITAKPFAKAQTLQERIIHFKKIIFDANEAIVEANNRLRVDMQSLNVLANHLRQDEREKLKIQDINYKPRAVKMPVTAKALKLTKKKTDKNELKRAAKELGVHESTIMAFMTMKQCTVAEALATIKANQAEAKAKLAQATPEAPKAE